jgi:hypothetical protein
VMKVDSIVQRSLQIAVFLILQHRLSDPRGSSDAELCLPKQDLLPRFLTVQRKCDIDTRSTRVSSVADSCNITSSITRLRNWLGGIGALGSLCFFLFAGAVPLLVPVGQDQAQSLPP